LKIAVLPRDMTWPFVGLEIDAVGATFVMLTGWVALAVTPSPPRVIVTPTWAILLALPSVVTNVHLKLTLVLVKVSEPATSAPSAGDWAGSAHRGAALLTVAAFAMVNVYVYCVVAAVPSAIAVVPDAYVTVGGGAEALVVNVQLAGDASARPSAALAPVVTVAV
jgi:hypothetical protein